MRIAAANGRVARGRTSLAWCVQCAWYVWLAWIALLVPLCGPARAYNILSEPPAGRFAMNLDLGTASVATSEYGVTTWKALAQKALNAWNETGIGPQQDHNFFSVRNPTVSGDACGQDGVNEVRFASTLCGLAFGSALAVTYKRISNGNRVESDVVFDSGRTWNAYSGARQAGISDFYRLALHEFGHVVGLDHPDEDGQIKTALMNSQIGNIYSLQADDIDGAHQVNWIWFSFPTQSGVALNAEVTSNTITVTGLSAPAAIGITGGQYSINGSPYTNASGIVSGGQSVTLRVTASRAPMTAVTATLVIGAAVGDFTAITTAGGTSITVNASSYLPLIDGSSKTYLKNGTDVIVSTVLPGTTLINGIATKAVQSSDGATSYDTNDGNGLREHREFKSNAYLPGTGSTAITVTFSPPILDAPAIATMGLPITSSGTANYLIPAAGINSELSYATSVTLEAFETVTVPAGTFNTIRVNQSINLSGFVEGNPVNQSSTGTIWVASGMGMVKSVVFSGDVTTRLLTSTSLATDATPDAFTLAPQIGISINSLVASNTVTVSGINAPASITITAGEYSINGGSYTSAAGTVNNRDTVTVRLAAADTYDTARSATLTIGGTSGTFTVTTVSDTNAPSVPVGLSADPFSAAQINLMWSASTDNVGVTQYKVYRNSTLIATLNAPVTGYGDSGLDTATVYTYAVAACDAAANCSTQSATIAATTLAGGSSNSTTSTTATSTTTTVVTTTTTTLSAQVTPIQFGSNFYEFVAAPGISWNDAKNAAAARAFNGVSGHLVTISSQAENDFLSSHFTTFTGVTGSWLGGQVNASGIGIWQVGPEAGQAFSQDRTAISGGYANWGGFEPNNASSEPSAVYMLNGAMYSDSNGHINHGQWADAALGLSSSSDTVVGYFVEYELPLAAGGTVTLNVVAGWNLVGNSSTGLLDVAIAFGDTTKVTTVWKWIANGAKWAFYAPSLVGQALTDYATSKGYDVLTTINGGEGVWVNAKTSFTSQLPSGTAVSSASFQSMASGWNLIAVGDSPTPSGFNKTLSATPPTAGDIPLNLTTLWAWDAALTNWYFYAPSLEKSNGLLNYIQSKNYLDFGTKTLTPTTGFWVNKP